MGWNHQLGFVSVKIFFNLHWQSEKKILGSGQQDGTWNAKEINDLILQVDKNQDYKASPICKMVQHGQTAHASPKLMFFIGFPRQIWWDLLRRVCDVLGDGQAKRRWRWLAPAFLVPPAPGSFWGISKVVNFFGFSRRGSNSNACSWWRSCRSCSSSRRKEGMEHWQKSGSWCCCRWRWAVGP